MRCRRPPQIFISAKVSCDFGALLSEQKFIGGAMEIVAMFFQEHEMCCLRDLHISSSRTGCGGCKEPPGIRVIAQTVPFTSYDQERGPYARRVVGKLAAPSVNKVCQRPFGTFTELGSRVWLVGSVAI